MENVITVVFSEENEAYRAFSEIKNDMINKSCVIAQLALLKKREGHIMVADSADSGVDTTDDTRIGGLVGLIVGVLGGPLGMLFGGAMGSLIGRVVDINDARHDASMIEQMSSRLHEGDVALVALAQEADETMLNARLSPYKVTIIRHDAATIAAEVEEAIRVQKEIEDEARKKLREAKKEEFMKKIERKGEELKAEFKKIYEG